MNHYCKKCGCLVDESHETYTGSLGGIAWYRCPQCGQLEGRDEKTGIICDTNIIEREKH